MQFKPFKVIMEESKEEANKELLDIKAKKVKSGLALHSAHIETELLSKQEQIHNMLRKDSVDVEDLLELRDDIKILEKSLKDVEETINELFPE